MSAVPEPILEPRWPKARLGHVAQYINGRAFKPHEWVDKGLPIIRIQNLNDPTAAFNYFGGPIDDKHYIRDGDLLVSWSASLDAFIWNRGEAALNQHIFKVEQRSEVIDRQYLYYALREVMAEIREQTHGATMKHINKPEFEAFEIPLPPLEEQQCIAARLTEQLIAVERARRASEARLEAARALSAAWLREVFTSGQARKWPLKRLGEIALQERGITYGVVQTGKHNPIGIPTVRGGDIKQFSVVPEQLKRIDPALSRKFNRTVLKGNEVLLAIRGAIGQSAAVSPALVGANVSREVAVIPLPEGLSRDYLAFALSSPFVQRQVSEKVYGAAQKGINLAEVRKLSVPVPTIDTQQSVARRIGEYLRRSGELQQKLDSEFEAFQAFSTSLLRKAFAGNL